MGWIKKRVWQLGIAVVLTLIGAWLIYTGAADQVNPTLLWLGLILVFVAMAIPLINRLYQSVQEQEGEKGET